MMLRAVAIAGILGTAATVAAAQAGCGAGGCLPTAPVERIAVGDPSRGIVRRDGWVRPLPELPPPPAIDPRSDGRSRDDLRDDARRTTGVRRCEPYPECHAVYWPDDRPLFEGRPLAEKPRPGGATPKALLSALGDGGGAPGGRRIPPASCETLRMPMLEKRPLDDARAQALAFRLVFAYRTCDAPAEGADIARLLADELPRLHAERAVTEETLWHWDHALSLLPLEVR